MPSLPNLYDVLQLPANTSTPLKPESVKSAFHRALLRHHPDKQHLTGATVLTHRSTEGCPSTSTYSIDEIITAYQTLVDPARKVAYDATVKQVSHDINSARLGGRAVHSGIEVHDLDDLTYDDAQQHWRLPCRCDNAQGYIVNEEELERASGDGEIYVGCRGCSLFVKITFAVVEDQVAHTTQGPIDEQ